jgi:RNA polymerase-associated protein RTF1
MATIRDKEEDPFTRRKCMPRLVTFVCPLMCVTCDHHHYLQGKDLTADDDKDDIMSQGHVSGGIGPDDDSMMMTNSDVPMDTTSANVSQVDDLFTAHDFDININLPTDAQGPSAIKSTPKSSVTTPRNNDGPRKSLNLSDYKKRRGLI